MVSGVVCYVLFLPSSHLSSISTLWANQLSSHVLTYFFLFSGFLTFLTFLIVLFFDVFCTYVRMRMCCGFRTLRDWTSAAAAAASGEEEHNYSSVSDERPPTSLAAANTAATTAPTTPTVDTARMTYV